MRVLVAILRVFIWSHWLPCSVNIMNSYAIKLHKVSGTKSGTNTRRDKAGQHPVPASAAAVFSRSGQRDSTPVGTKSGTNTRRDKAGQHPVPASAAAVFSRSGQRDSTPVFQTRRGSAAPLV
ncbi:hypothetical protein WRPBWLFC_CDS0055 [Escherichia phage SM_S22]